MDLPELVAALLRPGPYPHRVGRVRLVETHISWVLLTGEFAYKVKKPVNLGFLDFSTLARRRQACREELRLNRRWAPGLYRDVVPITGTCETPRVGDGGGLALEYAVRMRQFPQAGQLDRRLAAGRLTRAEVEAFAWTLGLAHAAAPIAPAETPYGSAAAVRRPAAATVAMLRERTRGPERDVLAGVRRWLASRPGRALLHARRRDGFIREGHGDLHLANLVRWRGVVQAFDCIEFDPALRWIDVLNDAAFLVMDLTYRGRPDLAYAFLNRYLEATGDYAGLGVLRYYLVYRALVRAKIASIRRASNPRGPSAAADSKSVRAHLGLARQWTRPARPMLVLMHGVSGSGKTHVSDALVTALPALRLRSDLERKRRQVLEPAQGGPAAAGYGAAAVHATYARLAQLASAVLAAGENVIVDATFLSAAERRRFLRLARRRGVPWVIVDCRSPPGVLARRVARRARAGADASDADAAVLARQLAGRQALTRQERRRTVAVDTARPLDARRLARRLAQAARG